MTSYDAHILVRLDVRWHVVLTYISCCLAMCPEWLGSS